MLTGLTLLLLMVLAYAIAFFQGWVGGSDDVTADSSQVTTAAPSLQPSEVSVNVYNANGEPGLARRVATDLEDRNFAVASIANDPENASIEHTADIRHGAEGAKAAALLQESVPGSALVADEREGSTIDLVLGDAFEELSPASPDESESTAAPTDE